MLSVSIRFSKTYDPKKMKTLSCLEESAFTAADSMAAITERLPPALYKSLNPGCETLHDSLLRQERWNSFLRLHSLPCPHPFFSWPESGAILVRAPFPNWPLPHTSELSP